MNDITSILSAIEQGDPQAAEQLLPLVYKELRRLAAQKMAQEAPGQTLQATALVHEAYLRLVDTERVQHWNSRGHFYAAAAEAMRRILVENARRKKALRRGGDRQRLGLDLAEPAAPRLSDDLLALDEALEKLAEKDRGKAELVKLRYFAGLTMEQTAETLASRSPPPTAGGTTPALGCTRRSPAEKRNRREFSGKPVRCFRLVLRTWE